MPEALACAQEAVRKTPAEARPRIFFSNYLACLASGSEL